jgi:glycosyltransferase involved in cell wall biosynthesis
MRTVSRATADRMRTLGQHCGISDFEIATPQNWRDSLVDFLSNTVFPAEMRAGIAFLAVNGAYPTRVEFDPIRTLVALDQPARSLRRILSNAYPARIRRGTIVLADPALTDITRFAAERFVSGIPRVVQNLLLTPAGQQLGRIVWSNGRPGIVTVDPETGKVWFPADSWIRANRRARWGSKVVNFLQLLAGRSPGLAFAVVTLARWIPVPAVVLGFRHPEPRTCVLLQNTTLVIAEVMAREVADRLTTWQRVGLNVSTRFVVHDFLPLTHSRFFSPASAHEHLLNLEAFASGEHITVATPLLSHELSTFCAAIGRPTPPIEVAPLPIATTPRAEQSLPKPSNPYVVFMGGFESRKRLAEFVEYVLAHRAANDEFIAVIVGKPPIITEKHEYALVSTILRNRRAFRLASGLTDSALTLLMAEALAVVYVSDAEGYGLPILESLSVGTPVITTSNELSRHFKDLYGGILDVFDESDATIRTIRSLTAVAHRSSIVSTIKRDAVPRDIDMWASKITDGLVTDQGRTNPKR